MSDRVDTAGMGTSGADADGHIDRLRRYYEETWFEYRLLWLDPRTRAMHFGYEQPGVRGHGTSLLALNHVMAEHAGLRAGQHVLDAGCGVGGTTMWLADVYSADVVGINVVADHVERARRYARERRLFGQVTFEVADYTSTPFASGSFEVVWAQESACHAPDKAAFAAEAFRLLGDGGRLVMAEYVVVDDARTTAGTSARSSDLHDWERAWEMTLASASGWTDALIGAGFSDVQVDDITPQMTRSLRRLRRLCFVLAPVAHLLHGLRFRTQTQQRNIAGSLAMCRALDRGEWRYAIITATRAR